MVKVNPVLERARVLKNDMAYASVLGNYKEFKEAAKEYAKIGVQHFEEVRKLPSPKATVPLFSRPGMRMLKVMILNYFRIKTPEEKEFKKMAAEYKQREEAERFITQA